MANAADRKAKMGAVIRAASGNFLELYDFLVYIYFASYIAKAYFPAQTEFMSLMLALGTYGVASFARPFGAVILGSYMDRKGRRKGLILTLTLMAVGTVSVAITPSYAAIGILAPIVITLGRLIQGFSLGVEAGGVNVYLAEIATPGNRGFYCAWQGSSQALGVMAATALGVLLTATLSMEQMGSFGWRIPLIVGCAIVPILFWLRRGLQETEVFEHSTHARSTREILRILGEHWALVVIGVMMTILNTTTFYFVNGYTPTFGTAALHLAPLGNFTVALVVGTASFLMLPAFGALSDRIGRWPLIIGSPLLVLATAYPAMSWLVAAPSFLRLLLVEMWLAVLYAMYAGTLVPLLAELMPAKVRSSGYAIIISLANGIFGTFTPAISQLLIQLTGNRASPALWLSAAAAVSLLAALMARRVAVRPSLQAAPT
ncbi:MAG TPA: tricarballylate/proton symporter TcuC [Micropepsaceae bacterium]|jgi:MFS family permease|nr:tricarballylate/proton symporter TcuC [Micropepsaceae bacterium]